MRKKESVLLKEDLLSVKQRNLSFKARPSANAKTVP